MNLQGFCKMHQDEIDKFGIDHARFDPSNEVSDEECNVKRSELSDRKSRSLTYGFLVSFYSCGIIAGFDESIRSESPRRVLRHLIKIGKFFCDLPMSNDYL